MGGKHRPRFRANANGLYPGPRDPGFFAEAAERVKELGYSALKFDAFRAAHRFLDVGEERLSLSIVRAKRYTVGDDVDMLIEGHDRFSVSTAIRIGKQLEEFRPVLCETPGRSGDIAATVVVARAIGMPVATGECFNRLSQFLDLLSYRVVDIVQPEMLHIGDIAGARRVAAIAEAAEAFVALH